MDPKRLEGVIPKQAVCAHCEYQFGGVAIERGRIRCPECGRDTDFLAALRATGEIGEAPPVWRAARRLLNLIAVGVVIVLIVWLTRAR